VVNTQTLLHAVPGPMLVNSSGTNKKENFRINKFYSVGDDLAIWKWDMNGEPVSYFKQSL
jgi:hypothetical protein